MDEKAIHVIYAGEMYIGDAYNLEDAIVLADSFHPDYIERITPPGIRYVRTPDGWVEKPWEQPYEPEV